MEEIDILKFVLTMDSTDLLKGLSKSDKAFGSLIDVFLDFNKSLEKNKSQLKDSMRMFGAMDVALGSLKDRIKKVNNELGSPLPEAAIDKFTNHVAKSIQAVTKESHKLQKQFKSIENIQPKIEFDIAGLKKVGAETSDIIALKDKLFSKEARTTEELKQQKNALLQLIAIRKAESKEETAYISAYRKAKLEQIEMAKRLSDIEGKALKEGVSKQVEPALNKLKTTYHDFFENISDYGSKQITEMMDRMKHSIGSIEKDVSRAAKSNKEAFQKEQMQSSSSSEARKYSALAKRVKPEITKLGGDEKDAIKLEMELAKLAQQFAKLAREMEAGVKPAAELDREFKRLQNRGKQLNDVFKEQKAVVKQAVDEFQNQRKRMYDIANIGESMMMQAGLIGGAFALAVKEFTGAFLQFEEVYNKLRGVSFTGDMEALNTQSQRFKDTAQEVAGKTSFMAHEITQAGVAMVKVGFTLDQTTQSIEAVAQAAEASGESMETVAEITAGVINAFGLAVSDTQMVIDTLTRGAIESAADIKSLGETLKYVGPIALATSEAYDTAADAFSETAAMATFLGKNMVLGSQAGTTLRQMLIRLTKVTPEARAVMDALNVSFTDSNGKMKKQSEFLIELSHALDNVTPSMRNMALATIFGERAITGTSAALNQISKDEHNFRKTIQNFSKDAEGMTKKMQEISFTGLTAEIKKFLASFDAFKVSLGEAFSGPAKGLLIFLREMVDTFNSMPKGLKSVTVWITSLTALFFGMVAVGGALIKMYASLNQGILFLAGTSTTASFGVGGLTKSLFTLQGASTGATIAIRGLGVAIRLFQAISIIGIVLAVASAFSLLAGSTSTAKEEADAYTKTLQAQRDMEMLVINTKKEMVDILRKEREGYQLTTAEIEKKLAAHRLEISELNKKKAAFQNLVDFVNDVGNFPDLTRQKNDLIQLIDSPNISDEEVKGLIDKLTELDEKLLESKAKVLDFLNAPGVKDRLEDKYGEVAVRKTINALESVSPQLLSQGFTLKTLFGDIIPELSKIEKHFEKIKELEPKFELSKKLDKANEALEKQKKLLDELYALENNLESEKEKLKIKERISSETEEYIRLAIIVEELSGQAGRTETEILEAVNKKYEIQKKLYELQESGKNSEKSKLELLIKQNDQRQKEIDLIKERELLEEEKAYARSIGAETYSFGSGGTPGFNADSIINAFSNKIEAEKEARDARALKSLNGSILVEPNVMNFNAGSGSVINDMLEEEISNISGKDLYQIDEIIYKFDKLFKDKYGYKSKEGEILGDYLTQEELKSLAVIFEKRQEAGIKQAKMTSKEMDELVKRYFSSLSEKYKIPSGESIPVSKVSKTELGTMKELIAEAEYKYDFEKWRKDEIESFASIGSTFEDIDLAINNFTDALSSKYGFKRSNIVNADDLSSDDLNVLQNLLNARESKLKVYDFFQPQMEDLQRQRDENLDSINAAASFSKIANIDEAIKSMEGRIKSMSDLSPTDSNLELLRDAKGQYDTLKSQRISAERELNQLSIKNKETQIKRERAAQEYEKKSVIENYELEAKLLSLTTADRIDDLESERKAKLASMKKQMDEEKKSIVSMYLGASDAEKLKQIENFEKTWNKKKEIIEKEHAYSVYEYKRDLEEKLFAMSVDNNQKRIALLNDPKMSGISVALKYASEELKLENDIKNEANKFTQDEISLLKDKLNLIKQIKNQEITTATLEGELAAIENLKTFLSLAEDKDYVLKEIYSVTSMISNIEQKSMSKGLAESVSDFQKITEAFKSVDSRNIAEKANKDLGERNSHLKEQIKLIDDLSEKEIADMGLDAFNKTLQKRNELEKELNNNTKTQLLLSDELYIKWKNLDDQLDELRFAYDPLNNAANEFSRILKDTPFGAFADAVSGATELGGKIFNLVDKAKDLPVLMEKAAKTAGTTGGDLFSGAQTGGMSLTGAGIGAALASPTMISAMIALAPVALDIAKTIGSAMLDAFFPGSSRAAREFKRNITNDLISARESIDTELLARGDISKAIFNERRLEDAAISYGNKLTELEDDIWDRSMDAIGRNIGGLLAAQAFDTLTPFGIIFGMFTENEAEKQFREEMEQIGRYAELARERLKLEQEKTMRALESDKMFGDVLSFMNFGSSMADVALMNAKNFGGRKGEIEAQFNKTMFDLVKEGTQSVADYTVDLDADKLTAKTAEIEARTVEAKRTHFEALNSLQAEQRTQENNHLDRMAQVNNKLGEYAKQEISIRTNLANQLIEVERKISEARNKGDNETVQFLLKEKQVIEAEGANAIQRSADEARKAFVDFSNELAQAKAKMTSSGKDDALVSLNTELGNIQDRAGELIRKFPELTSKIEMLQSAMIKSAFRTYNEAVLSEESELLSQERGILAKSFLLEGNDLEATKQDIRNQAQELIDELEITKLMNAGDDSDETRRMIENKEKITQQAIAEIAIEGFRRLAELRQQDLDDYMEIQKLKSENAFNPYSVVSEETQSQLNAIAFEKYVAQQTIKNQEKLNNRLELLNQQEKKLRREGVDNAAAAAIEQLNRIKSIREDILEDATKTYELDIKKNQREIDLQQREVDVLQRKRDQIQREIEFQQKGFNKADKEEFQTFISGFSVPQEVMDALEFISNPLANKFGDASYISVLEGIQKESEIGKRSTEVAYTLEDIDAQQYYEELRGIAGNQAVVAKYALGLVEDQQQAELARLKAKGATEGEIMLMEKRQNDERLDILEFYAEAYEDYQNAELGLIEARHEKELELNDDLIREKEDGIQTLEWANQDLQWKIDELSMAAQDDYDLIDKKVKEIEQSTRNWGFTNNDVLTKLPELVDTVGSKFDELRGKIEGMKGSLATGMPNASELGAQLAAQQANKFSDLVKSPADMDIGQWREQHYYGTEFANQTDEMHVKPPSRASMTTTDPEGWFTIQSPKTNRWYRTNTEMGVDEQLYAMGMSKGGMAGVTRNGLNGARDYIPVKAKDKELFAPIRDFRSFAQDLTHRALIRSGHGGYAKNDVNLSMSFGNVYGVDDLIGTIDYAIKKSNKELGYYNAPYTSGNT